MIINYMTHIKRAIIGINNILLWSRRHGWGLIVRICHFLILSNTKKFRFLQGNYRSNFPLMGILTCEGKIHLNRARNPVRDHSSKIICLNCQPYNFGCLTFIRIIFIFLWLTTKSIFRNLSSSTVNFYNQI